MRDQVPVCAEWGWHGWLSVKCSNKRLSAQSATVLKVGQTLVSPSTTIQQEAKWKEHQGAQSWRLTEVAPNSMLQQDAICTEWTGLSWQVWLPASPAKKRLNAQSSRVLQVEAQCGFQHPNPITRSCLHRVDGWTVCGWKGGSQHHNPMRSRMHKVDFKRCYLELSSFGLQTLYSIWASVELSNAFVQQELWNLHCTRVLGNKLHGQCAGTG